MVVAPGYYRGAMTEDVLEEFFTEIADASPVSDPSQQPTLRPVLS